VCGCARADAKEYGCGGAREERAVDRMRAERGRSDENLYVRSGETGAWWEGGGAGEGRVKLKAVYTAVRARARHTPPPGDAP